MPMIHSSESLNAARHPLPSIGVSLIYTSAAAERRWIAIDFVRTSFGHNGKHYESPQPDEEKKLLFNVPEVDRLDMHFFSPAFSACSRPPSELTSPSLPRASRPTLARAGTSSAGFSR
jgi:hypothetical protein